MAFLERFLIFSVFTVLSSGRTILLENALESLQESNCSCDWRYFKHYETKDCYPQLTDSCSCPQKFICPFNQTEQVPSKVCTFQSKEYKVGSKIITSNICQRCRCRDGTPPFISCVSENCPDIEETPGKDCHLIYKDNKCCPVGVECFKNESDVTSNKTCEYDGRLYPFGSKIYPVDDPCQTCICDENWNGVDNSSCFQQDCLFERSKSKLDAGCIPIYHESRCCPVEFYCPSSHNLSYSLLSSNESSDGNASYDNQCVFADQFYALGEKLFIGNPCVKCSCIVPPEFTCVHQSCPPSPNAENCFANFESGECCPTYECMLGDAESHPDCPTPMCADASCKIEIPLWQRCPTCVCHGCPTPMCANSSCHIGIPPGHECPTCICGENNSELEHNTLEQVQQINQKQIQQISQDFEQLENSQQTFEPYHVSSDYSEDELQMMPIRMQESEGQFPILEKMILLPESDGTENQYSEGLSSLEENSFEDNYNSKMDTTDVLEESEVANEENSKELDMDSLSELDLNESYNETVSNQSEKVQKRSDVPDAANSDQPETTSVEQQFPQQVSELNEDIEREGGDSEVGNGDFYDELESFKNKIFDKNKTTINEIFSINHVVKVPPGCPTPMCEGPWCKIGILPGEKCPTCICKRHSEP